MQKDYCNVGKLLADKNAIFNYIPDGSGDYAGVVVGMKGRDRSNPLVGWALFSEFDDGRLVMDKRSKKVKEALLDVYDALDAFADICGNKVTADFVEDIKLQIDTPEEGCAIPKDIKYRALELALLRANPDRENYFVSTNPEYSQINTDLRPYEEGGSETTVLTEGTDYLNPYDRYVIPYIRKACRFMEFRCWRYFKDFKKEKASKKVVNPKRWFTGKPGEKPVKTPYGNIVISYVYSTDVKTGLPKIFLAEEKGSYKVTPAGYPDWLFIRRHTSADFEQWWVIDAYQIVNYMSKKHTEEEAISKFFDNYKPGKFDVSQLRHWFDDNSIEYWEDEDGEFSLKELK